MSQNVNIIIEHKQSKILLLIFNTINMYIKLKYIKLNTYEEHAKKRSKTLIPRERLHNKNN